MFSSDFFSFYDIWMFCKKEGGRLIWHGTRLVGVYLMLSGWSADRRIKKAFLSASSYDKQDLAKKATSPLTARRFSLQEPGLLNCQKKLTIQEIVHVG